MRNKKKKQLLKLSPTLIDGYRYYLDYDFKTLEELESQIRREPVAQTEKMLIGGAYDKFVLNPYFHKQPDPTEIDGFLFDKESAKEAVFTIPAGGSYQVWVDRIIECDGWNIKLLGKVDYVWGSIVADLKTKTGSYQIENFAEALQWAAYCEILGTKAFTYRVASLRIPKKNKDDILYTTSVDDLDLYYDKSIRANLYDYISRFLSFCESRGLIHCLEVGFKGPKDVEAPKKSADAELEEVFKASIAKETNKIEGEVLG